MRSDLLPLANNPKSASTINDLQQKLEDWDTNRLLMVENGASLPNDETRRLAFVEMLPAEINAYITMRLDDPSFDTFSNIKKYALKYVKVLQKQKKKKVSGGVHLFYQEDKG